MYTVGTADTGDMVGSGTVGFGMMGSGTVGSGVDYISVMATLATDKGTHKSAAMVVKSEFHLHFFIAANKIEIMQQ